MRNPSGSYRDAPLTVSFPVPKKAASKLRSLAISKDRRLLDLGVLAVQINEGESIVLGIKLGRRRLKKTEVESDKLRGNSSAGRVAKRHSTCRNVATIHHMPASSSQVQSLPASKIPSFSFGNDEEKSTKRAAHSEGDVTANELFNGSNPGRTAENPSNDYCKLRGSDYTTSSDASVLSHGQSNSSSAKESTLNKQENSSGYATKRSFVSTESSMHKITHEVGETKGQTPSVLSPVSEKAARLVAGNESNLPAVRRLSSPGSQRAYSASPGSDTSSTSSEENLDAQQLIYSCFVDRSKYSAADMLKQLAEAHASKEETTDTIAAKTNALPRAVKPGAATTKSSSGTNFPSEQPRMLDSSKRPAVPGSYREHVKNIRCNSITSLTTSTLTVNSNLKSPTSTNKLHTFGFQSPSGNIDRSVSCGERKLTMQDTMTHLNQAKPSAASQIKSVKTGSTQTPAYRGGRKVLWSSANAFPSITKFSAHQPVSKPTTVSPKVHSPSSKSPSLHCQVQESTTTSSFMKSGAAICNETAKSIASDTHLNSFCTSNKVSGQQSVNDCRVLQNDSKTVIVKTPSLSSDSQESVTLSDTSSSQAPASISFNSPCNADISNVAQMESQVSNQLVQNLTLATSTLPSANVILPGTNTQTTWSSQQVSPTYFVGTQGQYGIYRALYNTDVNNNQLGQQGMTATYPLNYVYPISFVYPYLSMAQANSGINDKVQQQNEDTEVMKTDTSLVDTASYNVHVGKSEPDVAAPTDNGNTVNLESTSSSVNSTAPVQTHYIDLANSMRYWQQLSLLYRSRWQALASCNLSNVATMTSNSASAAATVTSVADESSTTVVNNTTTAVRSNLEQQSPSKLDTSQANLARDLQSGSHKPTSELCGEMSLSEILQRVKPEINSEEQSLQDLPSDRPSVIVAAACKDSTIGMPDNSSMEMKMQCKSEEFDGGELQNTNERRTLLNSVSYGTSSTEEDEISPPPLHHYNDKLRNMAKDNVGRASFHSSTPKLSFIHDSSIACVNIGNSNGNGYGFTNSMPNHPGARRTSLGTQLDPTVRPAKRKKAKRSL